MLEHLLLGQHLVQEALLELSLDGVEDLAERLEFGFILLVARIAIEQILNVLVNDVEVLAEAEVHPPERLTHLDHLLLDVLCVLLRLLLVPLLENVLPVLC